MKMLNAYTLEIDDFELAIAEIKEQLDLEHNMLAHAAGFITCSYDYVEAGLIEAISDAMPFDIVGCTTLTNAVNDEGGGMLLCLSVLTASDCRFASAASESLADDLDGAIARMYDEAAGKLDGEPRLALAFFPMATSYGGELILDALDRAAGGTPIFGTIACDFDTAHYSHSCTFHNGLCTTDRASVLLISGNVAPRFVVTSTSEQNLHKQQALITASEGSLLKEVNGMTAREYFHSLGLMRDGGIGGMSSVPFVVNYNDGTQPVARAIYSLCEDGSAVCGGRMPEGGTLSIGRMDVADILLTADTSLQKLLRDKNEGGIILFPCLGRNMVLGMDPLLEVKKVREIIGDALPWHLAYSGGEVCPVYGEDGNTANRFHNFTFIGCAI
ncbi:FIST C-terminal domain-containing protein [Synergistaceae bacterium OttesenSCG-928-I11]|nr:FIST C-terminal domain-containing protein [Synergistaceae bacterium OttesenSCG-928-I11]